MKGKSSHHRPTQDNAGRPCDPSVEDREDDGLWLPISLPLGTPPLRNHCHLSAFVAVVTSATSHYHLLWGTGQQVAVGQVVTRPCYGQTSGPIPDGLLHVPQRPLSLLKLVTGLLGSWEGRVGQEVRGAPTLIWVWGGHAWTCLLPCPPSLLWVRTGPGTALWACQLMGRPHSTTQALGSQGKRARAPRAPLAPRLQGWHKQVAALRQQEGPWGWWGWHWPP